MGKAADVCTRSLPRGWLSVTYMEPNGYYFGELKVVKDMQLFLVKRCNASQMGQLERISG
jgi:hypothetical protein